MATSTGKAICFNCGKEKIVYECRGCSQDFCFNHLNEHRQTFNQSFTQIEYDYINKRLLIQQINQWEENSIYKIKQTAKESRHLLTIHTNRSINDIENKFKKLIDQIKEIRRENEFNELDLNQLKIKLIKLTKELDNPSNVSIIEEPTSFLNNIFVIISQQLNTFNNINLNTIWKQNGTTVAGGNGRGDRLNQLSSPQGICVDDDQTIYIADWLNHRIIAWKPHENNGQIVAGGNDEGNQMNQLRYPTNVIIDKENDSIIISDRGNRRVVRWSRQNNINGEIIISDIDCWGLTMDKNRNIYTSDTVNHEVRKWRIGETNGTIVAGGNGQGNRLNQLNFPSYIFVDEEYSVYISDDYNHRVMKWIKDAEEGIIVAGGIYWGSSLTELYYPQGVIVDQLGQIYVVDSDNHRIMRWRKEATEGDIIVGGNTQGNGSNQINCPKGLSFDQQGNLYVVDQLNHRVQKFEINLN